MSDRPPEPDEPTPDGVSRRLQRELDVTGRAPAGVGAPSDTPSDEDLIAEREARPASTGKSQVRNAVEWVAVIAGALLIAVIVRTFIFQTFWIPSPSMATTLVKDDRVLVNKLSYRFHEPRRGDVIVFERPANEDGNIKDLIKRVIGLPGDRVSIMDGQVAINGKVLDEPYTHGLPTEAKIGCGPGVTTGIDTEKGFTIPEGHLFVMGDNRINSLDGRCFGPIDEDLVVGRAFVIIWPPSKTGGL